MEAAVVVDSLRQERLPDNLDRQEVCRKSEEAVRDSSRPAGYECMGDEEWELKQMTAGTCKLK